MSFLFRKGLVFAYAVCRFEEDEIIFVLFNLLSQFSRLSVTVSRLSNLNPLKCGMQYLTCMEYYCTPLGYVIANLRTSKESSDRCVHSDPSCTVLCNKAATERVLNV